MMTLQDAPVLTARELEVLRHVARGRTNPEIATFLGISLQTVKNHLTNVYDKLDTRSRDRAARIGIARAPLVTPLPRRATRLSA